MTYEAWRITFQSSEQAARSAYQRAEKLAARVANLEAENGKHTYSMPEGVGGAKWIGLQAQGFRAIGLVFQDSKGRTGSVTEYGRVVWEQGLAHPDDSGLTRQAIMSSAILHGFKLRPQEGREDDLNEYVYSFAREMFRAGQRTGAALNQTAASACQGHAKQQEADTVIGLRSCNSLHGSDRAGTGMLGCRYRMRITDPGCTGCADRDEGGADHANELRRMARKIGHPAGDVPAVMRAAADRIDELERLVAAFQRAEAGGCK